MSSKQKEVLISTQVYEVAERLHRYVNPNGKMECPNSVYATTDKWYGQYCDTDTDLTFFDWCIKNKK